MQRIAVDVGGTFTDLIGVDGRGKTWSAKTLTTPRDQAVGILNAVDEAGADLSETRVLSHGTTVAINAVLERRGAKTGLITTAGFRDIYEIGRGSRPDPYNLLFRRPEPLVPRVLRREVRERVRADGSVHTELDVDGVREQIGLLSEAGVEAVAVCLLHSYANPEHEAWIGELLREGLPHAYVSLSHQIMREYREYERTSTTVLNAYVGPVVSRYLDSLEDKLSSRGFSGRLLVMQSNGGVMSVKTARETPVRMMESGPVAGVIGTAKLARQLGHSRAISFDMGGTTAKTSLVKDGNVDIAAGYYIGGYETGQPMMLPVADIVEVGSGGGSIAFVDAGGGLKVGPDSAGADPGPACYRRGGDEPTVTDANLVLGRLGADNFLGGAMPLDAKAATAAVREKVGANLNISEGDAAMGIVAIANAHMALAVRAVSVERGEDPRDCVLVATGGAGPLHAAAIAHELDIATVIVPVLPGQFSAAGMLACDVRHDLLQTFLTGLDDADLASVARGLKRLSAEARELLAHDAGKESLANARLELFLDLRYRGQEFTIATPVPDEGINADNRHLVRQAFDELHLKLYGHSAPEESVELVALRATIKAPSEMSETGKMDGDDVPTDRSSGHSPEADLRDVYGRKGYANCAVYQRAQLSPGDRIDGPAIVEEVASTTVILDGDELVVDGSGALIIRISTDKD